MRSTALVAVLAVVPSLLAAQSAPANTLRTGPTVGFAADLSLELGGDDFLEVLFTSGDTQKIRAGQGGTIAVGGIFRPSAASPLSLRATLGIKYVTTAAQNANITFTRIPLELVGSYALPNGARFGAGLVYHARNRFNGDGFVDDETFDATTGVTAEVGYKAIALTYTAIKYKAQGGPSIDGGSVGVQLLWTPKAKTK